MNVAALEIFNQLRLQHFGIGHFADIDWNAWEFGQLCGAISLRPEYDLEPILPGSR